MTIPLYTFSPGPTKSVPRSCAENRPYATASPDSKAIRDPCLRYWKSPYPKTLARYAEIGRFVGLTGKDDKEVFEKLLDKLEELKKIIEIKPTIKDYGVDEKYFLETLDEMSEQAFNDQCTGANPRYPLIAELKEIYLKAYYGK